ncbi:hypothetical protein WH06_23080 [Aeromonas salmonicida subsp. salmonicida]|jgi:hypothetical protein|uniref:Uncharacterized protein n=2 Tax=Aeromonas salmonicida subsp. salmonicida TaxID=29491 RepID=A0A1Z3MNQ8_AERSS|nr:hypothetical protein [Aeromonas salmonicida subsp. salmonicida]EHI50210.1 hypothetical protein IYQ_22900 [Aeromonas salmonicida subsp. salmonicida 01-B526]BBU06968.1 hypothetical protein WP9W18E04_P10550 [Aeromonas veronii]OAH81095.1 hypothetical protein AXW81_02265 [Aeromonas salmonicida subsp. salmonicida]OKA73061.1 hypothetical protein BHR40_23385 [Aeromonas salmonicida subsp. salmonicida]
MPNDKPPKDPWCNPLEMPDGSKISGAPARERRIKLKGGIPAIIKESAAKAVEAALAIYQTEQTQVTPPPPSPRPVRKRQPTVNQPGHTPGNLH